MKLKLLSQLIRIGCLIVLMLCKSYSLDRMNTINNKILSGDKQEDIKHDITGISFSKSFNLSKQVIEDAISKNRAYVIKKLAYGCIYTNDPVGRFDLTLIVSNKYISEGSFILKGKNSSIIKADLMISSSRNKNLLPINPNKSLSLSNHSDKSANGTRCANRLFITLSINPEELRKAKPGQYSIIFNASANDYSA